MQKYLVANYHTHTPRCKHASGTEEEYIKAAVRAGIKVLGFADHVPCPPEDGFVSGIRMGMEEAADYVRDIRALQKKYEDQIQICVGFEAEYIPWYYEKQMELFEELGIDYMIMGQHFLGSEQERVYAGMPNRTEEFLIAYVDRVIEGMKTGSFLYLAHPDLVRYEGEETVYRREITRLCVALKDMAIPLEINLLGILEGRHYPRELFWEIAGEAGNEVIIGIDAHSPDQIGKMDYYRKGIALVEKYNLHLIDGMGMIHR